MVVELRRQELFEVARADIGPCIDARFEARKVVTREDDQKHRRLTPTYLPRTSSLAAHEKTSKLDTLEDY